MKVPQNFEHYVTGISNRLAYAAAKSVSEKPSEVYNPLFISGGVATGKTHLLKAIEKAIHSTHKHLVVKYLQMDFFNDLFLYADTDDALKIFREEMRVGDVFLFDDLDHISQKESTIEEFFHTFNDIFQKNKQVVITSEWTTKELELFPQRLVSRLEWGLCTHLQEPQFETKLLIFENIFEFNQIKVDKSISEFLARKFEKSVSTMFEYVNELISTYDEKGQIFESINSVKSYLDEKEKLEVIEAIKIQQVVSKTMKVNLVDILSKSRLSKVVEARHIAIYLTRLLTKHTFKEIGILFGRRHHSTIMHAEEEIKNRLENDSGLRLVVNELIQQIKH